MGKKYSYSSSLSDFIEGHIRQKRSAGFIYNFEAYILRAFDDFLILNNYSEQSLTREIVQKWAVQRPTESRGYRAQRMSFIRQLSIYINGLGINSYIPKNFSSKHTPAPRILNTKELLALFKIIDTEPCSEVGTFKRMAYEYRVLFRLFYCCGLRLAEGCYLKSENVDLDNGVLKIFQSKGNKDRLVYMPDDLTLFCREYWGYITIHFSDKPVWFFPSRDPSKPIPTNTLDYKFRQFWNQTQYSSDDKAPTVHSLRHSFVVDRMNSWMADGVNFGKMMAYLSKYLGHSSINETFYYYHQVEKAFYTVRKCDTISQRVIPEVALYEE